jgi:hypothetical protein
VTATIVREFERLDDVLDDTGRDASETGGELAPALRRPALVRTSISRVRLDEETARKGEKLIASLGGGGPQKVAALSLLMTWTPAIPFGDLAELVGVSADKLLRLVHGSDPIPQSRSQRIEKLTLILTRLAKVLDQDASSDWLAAEVPALRGKTPRSVIKRGDLDRVLALTESYLDPSFG